MEVVRGWISSIKQADTKKVVTACAVVAVTAVAVPAAVTLIKRSRRARVKKGNLTPETLPADAFDAIIVGSGPSGSVCGFFMAKAGARVCTLDKANFPRDKYCGDAVCTPAIRILEQMGVMKQLLKNNEAHFADAGGFVSPSGVSYIGESKEKLGEAACCAVKRINLDNRLARTAQAAGVNLVEGAEVSDAKFDKEGKLWTVYTADGRTFMSRVLVCADGATSRLATKLGYCTEPPKGICSRAFIEPPHNTDFDGVCFYQRESLPGYSAIFKHPDDVLNFCYYLIPCGKDGMCGDVSEADLARLHNDALKKDPYISRAVGNGAKVERMRAASLRLGSQGLKTSFDDHLLIIGDAAGHIDPLTGEGIHTAMMGGKVCAETILEMREAGDFSAESCGVYRDRWMEAFGHDFYLSTQAARLIYRFPILLDACAAEMQRKGDKMMAKWAEIMTGMQPKTYFLRPHIALPLMFAVVREFIKQKVLGMGSKYDGGMS